MEQENNSGREEGSKDAPASRVQVAPFYCGLSFDRGHTLAFGPSMAGKTSVAQLGSGVMHRRNGRNDGE